MHFVRAAVLVIAAVMTADHVFVTSLRPHRVEGGSMTPFLIGRHYRVPCDGCGRVFPVLPMPGDAPPPFGVCPHCGRRVRISADNGARSIGDLIWILRSPFLFRRPGRWEVVGIRDPSAASRMLVKRIVGLPGETVTIREGDLFVNGSVCRKPWPVLRTMSAPLPLTESSRGTRPLPHEVCLASPATNYCYFHPGWDQLEFPTRDLVLFFTLREFSMESGGTAKLRISADDGDRGWVVTFDFAAGQATAEQGPPPNGAASEPGGDRARDDRTSSRTARFPPALQRWMRRSGTRPPIPFAVSLADRRLLVLVQDETVLDAAYDPPPITQAVMRPFLVEAEGATGRIADVRVMRDVYYLPPYETAEPTPQPFPEGESANAFRSPTAPYEPLRFLCEGAEAEPNSSFTVRLPPGKYLVLGDDSHSSKDGRYWRPDFGIAGEWILGRAIVLRTR